MARRSHLSVGSTEIDGCRGKFDCQASLSCGDRADGLPDIHVNDIIETRSGDYWIGTDGGVVLFRPAGHGSRFMTYTPPGPERARLVNAVLENRDRVETLLKRYGVKW